MAIKTRRTLISNEGAPLNTINHAKNMSGAGRFVDLVSPIQISHRNKTKNK